VFVEPHETFRRDNSDVYSELYISFPEAVLGGEVEVETLYGKVRLKIQPGTRPGSVYRLKGKGIPHLQGSGKGDHFVKIDIEIPKKLSPRERELLGELAKEMGKKTGKKGFWQDMGL